MEVDVFDFDKTLYRGDSTVDFYFFCVRRRPWIILLLPVFGVSLVLFAARLISMEKLKTSMFFFLRFLREGTADALIKTFWDINRKKFNPFFTQEFMERQCIVISASPEALVAEGCRNRGVHDVIGTKMDMRTGKISGKNCRHIEKLRQLELIYPGAKIIRAFSDSITADRPLLEAAAEPYVVRNGVISAYTGFRQG